MGSSFGFWCMNSDAQNTKRVGLYTFCKTCRALQASTRLRIWQNVYNTLWFCILKSLKSLQNVLKSHQITPEVPKSMHLGHIFLLGLAKTVPLHWLPPQTCHVEKFQISVKNLNNLWSFIEVYAVFFSIGVKKNLFGKNLCGEKMTNMRYVQPKKCVIASILFLLDLNPIIVICWSDHYIC